MYMWNWIAFESCFTCEDFKFKLVNNGEWCVVCNKASAVWWSNYTNEKFIKTRSSERLKQTTARRRKRNGIGRAFCLLLLLAFIWSVSWHQLERRNDLSQVYVEEWEGQRVEQTKKRPKTRRYCSWMRNNWTLFFSLSRCDSVHDG